MTDSATYGSLIAAVERYFEMMFDYDVGCFEEVFAPTAQLHGLRDGAPRVLTAIQYRALLAAGPSPKSKKPLGTRLFFSSTLRPRPRRWLKFASGSMRRCMSTISHFIASTTRGGSLPNLSTSTDGSSKPAVKMAADASLCRIVLPGQTAPAREWSVPKPPSVTVRSH